MRVFGSWRTALIHTELSQCSLPMRPIQQLGPFASESDTVQEIHVWPHFLNIKSKKTQNKMVVRLVGWVFHRSLLLNHLLI